MIIFHAKLGKMVEFKNQKIFVSGRIWHELYPKVDPSPFLYALHQWIDLTKYGDGLKKYFFTFLALTPENKLHFPGTFFSRKRQEAEIAVVVPYEKIITSTDEETIKLMEIAYLEGIELIKTLPLKSAFDVDAFKKDVEAIFAQEKWWEKAME